MTYCIRFSFESVPIVSTFVLTEETQGFRYEISPGDKEISKDIFTS